MVNIHGLANKMHLTELEEVQCALTREGKLYKLTKKT